MEHTVRPRVSPRKIILETEIAVICGVLQYSCFKLAILMLLRQQCWKWAFKLSWTSTQTLFELFSSMLLQRPLMFFAAFLLSPNPLTISQFFINMLTSLFVSIRKLRNTMKSALKWKTCVLFVSFFYSRY